MSRTWRITGTTPPQDFTKIRLPLHYAVQFLAVVGATFTDPKPDHSHTSFAWNSALNLFVSHPIPAPAPFQVALDPISLGLIMLDELGQKWGAFALAQRRIDEGLFWLQQAISARGADVDQLTLEKVLDQLPDHALAHGARFDPHYTQLRQELTSYYHNTALLLQLVVASTPGASPIHIWPHHFDMATLLSVDAPSPGDSVSIGVGFSPGDSGYEEPYWYVTPWPYPACQHLPALAGGGTWHTTGWMGAILIASQLQRTESQQHQVEAFIHSALLAVRSLLMLQDLDLG